MTSDAGTPGGGFDAAALARRMLREARSVALGTLMAGSGDPYCSLVNVAASAQGCPLLLVSTLALHTQNLQADPRACLMVEQRGDVQHGASADPLQRPRLMLRGQARPDDEAGSRRRYLARHPAAEQFTGFRDFGVYRIVPDTAHLVAGFGRIVDLAPDVILTDLSDAQALVDAEPGICAHMNKDHADALRLYATRLLGAADGDWACVGCDPDGLDLQCEGDARRLTFRSRVTTPGELRTMLRQLAEAARSKADEASPA